MNGLAMSARSSGPVQNPVLLLLVLVAAVALAGTGFMSDAPNRLADGVALPLWRAPWLPASSVAALIAALGVLAFWRGAVDWASLAAASLLLIAVLITAGLFAKALAVPDHPAQREALGPAFWIVFATSSLATLDSMQRLALGLAARTGLVLVLLLASWALAEQGTFDDLSLMREFASHRPQFLIELFHHVVLVAGSLVASLVACAPLILAVRASARLRAALYPVLSLLQTIPSIALFGLLITPLTFFANHVPALKRIGVSGLGTTPAVIALVLYAAFPLVRMSDAAFSAVPRDVADAASGLGFGLWRRFVAVDLPLALPVLLSGLRVVTLQAIGLATVAALIGGGGLGTFIFEGIGEYALDLVLVGAIPVILMALGADFCFRVAMAAVERPA